MANPLIPPMNPNQMPPSPFAAFAPPPAPSPSLGFQVWAQDPQNALKVQPSMTPSDMPLQPNHPSNAGKMASVNPPPLPPMASANPPSIEGLSLPQGGPMAFPASPKPTLVPTMQEDQS